MNYETLFDDIIRSIRKDYAGAAEIKNPNEARDFSRNLANAFAQKKLDDVYFLRIMEQYLATIGDRNLTITLADNENFTNETCGFATRCYEKELYVTKSRDERIRPGDKIGKINAKSPKWYLEHLTKNLWWSDQEERMDWSEFFKGKRIRVRVDRPDGSREFMDLAGFAPEEPVQELIVTQPAEKTVCLRVNCFLDWEKLEEELAANEELLASCDKLILDLRQNSGGMDGAFYPLLPYLCDRRMKLSEFMGEQGIYTNYTKRNSRRRVSQLTPYLSAEDETIAVMANELIEEAKAKSGSGYVYEKDEDLAASELVLEPKGPERVVILLDTDCEDVAELLVQQASRMKKVTVIGRPSRGTIDYSNSIPVLMEGGFTFTYPISRSRDCEKGRGVKGVGLPVDEYIPWTPAEITEDVILQRALAL